MWLRQRVCSCLFAILIGGGILGAEKVRDLERHAELLSSEGVPHRLGRGWDGSRRGNVVEEGEGAMKKSKTMKQNF